MFLIKSDIFRHNLLVVLIGSVLITSAVVQAEARQTPNSVMSHMAQAYSSGRVTELEVTAALGKEGERLIKGIKALRDKFSSADAAKLHIVSKSVSGELSTIDVIEALNEKRLSIRELTASEIVKIARESQVPKAGPSAPGTADLEMFRSYTPSSPIGQAYFAKLIADSESLALQETIGSVLKIARFETPKLVPAQKQAEVEALALEVTELWAVHVAPIGGTKSAEMMANVLRGEPKSEVGVRVEVYLHGMRAAIRQIANGTASEKLKQRLLGSSPDC